MKSFHPPCAAVIAAILLGSCTTYSYDEQPEGYVVQTVPLAYTAVVIGGISYWQHHNHYYRHWPDHGYVVVRPPHGRPPYTRPPAHPGRPGHPGTRPPGTRPPGHKPTPLPSTQPVRQPHTPSYRPTAQPSHRPAARPSGRSGRGRR